MKYSEQPGPIGVFDSGYGGLTIVSEIRKRLPQYDYIYLGDNARTPYGTRSFEVVYEYTLQCVKKLFEMGSHLVVLACNTASAKALRNIQQCDLETLDPNRRVLGIIRPTVESISDLTQSRRVGLFATSGTVQSNSYPLEIYKLAKDIKVLSQACPMWVPLIENNEYQTEGAEFFIKKYVQQLCARDPQIDAFILGCTHYPLIVEQIKKYLPPNAKVISQGKLVADSLADYLHRHPEMTARCTTGSTVKYYTTESVEKFTASAKVFLQEDVEAEKISLK